MAELLHVLQGWLASRDGAAAMSDDNALLTREDVAARVAGLAKDFLELPQAIGLFGANGTDWALGMLAGWAAGKTVVPLPTFFSPQQLEHVVGDAGVEHVVTTSDAFAFVGSLGVGTTTLSQRRADTFPAPQSGAGVVVYTSGSTGRPKGVRLGLGQIDYQARALATAIDARSDDLNLSVLPLALLLETITAICVPVLVCARTHFASAVAESVGAGRPAGLLEAFEAARPATAVLVPQLLSVWIAELEASNKRAPDSLRFVAVGGARVAETLTERAWELGIPVHEGYGLTECCSVVTVNRPGRRKAGTVGEPLPGLNVRVEGGEVVVSGPTVMAGYLHHARAETPWRTGDLGQLDRDGYLSVNGRKDTLIVASSGRNISPEWIEAMVLSDPRVAAATVLGHGQSHLSVLLVPSVLGERWLMESPRAHILLWLERICADAPSYAVPKDFVLCPAAQAKRIGLLTSNGRVVREAALSIYPALKLARRPVAA